MAKMMLDSVQTALCVPEKTHTQVIKGLLGGTVFGPRVTAFRNVNCYECMVSSHTTHTSRVSLYLSHTHTHIQHRVSQLVLVGGALNANRWSSALQALVRAPPVRRDVIVVPQRRRLCVAHPLGIARVMTRLHQQGAC